jgi:carbon-monoxide dehydrogenase large subunit
MIQRFTGTSVRRVEDPRLLTGRGRYVDDLPVRDVLHAAFLRSPHAHARIRRIDTSAARARRGVVAVWHGADLPDWLRPLAIHAPPGARYPAHVDPLARDVVRYVGDPVAVVIATSRAVAEDGCDLIDVDYEPLAPVATMADALDASVPPLFADAGSNVVYDQTFTYGDPETVFAAASRVVRRTLRQSRHANLPMEGRAGLAEFDAGRGELVYHAAHQNPHALRVCVGAQLGLPLDRITVRCPDIGGSFGQKAYPGREDMVVCAAARHLEAPVKWIEDRSENLLAAGHARDEVIDVEAAVDDTGRVLAARVAMTVDQGAYPLGTLPSTIYPTLVRVLFPGPYAIDHLAFHARVLATNKASYIAYRGPWEAETWARERLLDAVATDLGLDPVEVRRRNLVPVDAFPRRMITGPTQERITIGECLERAVARIDVTGLRRSHDELRQRDGVYRGVGIAVVVEPAPGPPDYSAALGAGASPRGAQQARARLEPDGRVVVFTSQNPHGQSHHTTLAQLAADRMGVPFGAVRIVSGDTGTTPFNLVSTGGSRAATLASGAVLGAAGELRARVLDVAASMLEAAPDDLEIIEGAVQVRGVPAVRLALGDVARVHAPVEVLYTFEIPPGGWSQATHTCEVEVDIDTGMVRVLRYVVVGDCGRVINPAIVAGQIRGGIVQGIGSVLFEHFVYGDDGQPLTTTLRDYLVPTAPDVPPIEVEHLEHPDHGADEFRGVGEGGAIGAPAALSAAIEDALAPLGVRITDQFLPPARVLALIADSPQGAIR